MARTLTVTLLALTVVVACEQEPGRPATATSRPPSPTVGAPEAGRPDPQALVGSWLRPDGGYVLEVRSVAAGGSVDARYLNPRPIHVSRAQVMPSERVLMLFVELQDQGYPGATYDLRYVPSSDTLAGTYHQPAASQTFEVVFVRHDPEPEDVGR